MGLFRLPKRQRAATGFQPASKSQEAASQTFILEPILTPSGLVDGVDHHDLSAIEMSIHPVADLGVSEVAHATSDHSINPTLTSAADPSHSLNVPAGTESIPTHDLQLLPFVTAHSPLASEFSPASIPGVFTVGQTGQVSVDYLWDGGTYRGELAIFSLTGMDQLQPGSPEFIQEAAHRALSQSDLGHVVIQDTTEGAKFHGRLAWEGDFNQGNYLGEKTVQLAPGSQFAVMLVPNGTIESIAQHPSGSRPIFSIAAANTQGVTQFDQLGDVFGDGHTFAIEDQLIAGGKSDRDYNDLVFHVRGATGHAPSLDTLINAQRDWRTTDFGHQIQTYVTALDAPTDPVHPVEPALSHSGIESNATSDAAVHNVTPSENATSTPEASMLPSTQHSSTPIEHSPFVSDAPSADAASVDNAAPTFLHLTGEALPTSTPIGSTPSTLVGVIDTGLYTHSPGLDYSQVQLGHDYIDGDANPTSTDAALVHHGTQVVNLIEQTQSHGVPGVQDPSPIWVSRAVGSEHWADALVEFVDRVQATGQPHAVVNLSFDLVQQHSDGSVSTRFELTPQELAALQYAHDHHVVIVAAAGNQNGAISALGQASQQFDNLVTVGAAEGTARASYSSYGEGLDLLAPSETLHASGIASGEGAEIALGGTSAATAQVTGAVSLVWHTNPDLSYQQVIAILKQTATDVQDTGWDAGTGFGILNLVAAVQVAKQTVPVSVVTTASPGMPLAVRSFEAGMQERPTDTFYDNWYQAGLSDGYDDGWDNESRGVYGATYGERLYRFNQSSPSREAISGYYDGYRVGYPQGVAARRNWVDPGSSPDPDPGAGNGYGNDSPPGPSEPPEPTPPPPPPITYLDSLRRVLGKVESNLLGQLPGLLAAGKLVDDNQWFDFMGSVAYGVYKSAQNSRTPDTSEALGQQLVQKVRESQAPAIVEFYPAKLLVAAKLAQGSTLDDSQFVTDLAELGRAYAQLQPKGSQTAEARSFLSQLWQAQDENGIRQGATKLEEALQEVDDPARALRFISALLKAVKQVPALRQQVHDDKFLDEVVKLGLEYAKSTATHSGSNSDSLNFFLDTLWQASDASNSGGNYADQFLTYYIHKGAEELKDFLTGFNSDEKRLKLIQFERNLLKTEQTVAETQRQNTTTQVLAALSQLGRNYALIDPSSAATGNTNSHLFLDTLWRSQPNSGSDVLDESSQELTDFLSNLDTPIKQQQFLAFENRFLDLMQKIPVLKKVGLKDVGFVKEMLGVGQLYAAAQFSDHPTSSPANSSFLNRLWFNDTIQGKTVQQAQAFFNEFGGAAVLEGQVSFGLRLLIANERGPVAKAGNLAPDLTVQIAQLAHAYAQLHPDKDAGLQGFFLNTVWSGANTSDSADLYQLDQGAQELQTFLAGTETSSGFNPADQPKVLEFETKLLTAASLTSSSVLGPDQKKDPQLLDRLFVQLGRDAAQFQLNNQSGQSNSQTFLDALWNASVKDKGAISKGVSELQTFLRAYGLTIDSLDYIGKAQQAFNRLGKYLRQDFFWLLQDIYQNLGPILAICGFIGGGLLSPLAPFVAALLTILDIILTAKFGIRSVQGLFDFFIDVNDAQDEAGIDKAAQDLAHAIENGAVAVVGISGLFKSFSTQGPKVLKTMQTLTQLSEQSIREILGIFKFFTTFKDEPKIGAFIKQGSLQDLWKLAAYLSQHKRVFDLLAGLLGKSDKLLEEVLKLRTKAIDELDVIIAKGATAEQILKLRFEVKGMSLAELKNLLDIDGMTPNLLEQLLDNLNKSLPKLKQLLSRCPDPAQLERLLTAVENNSNVLLQLLDKCPDPTLLEKLLNEVENNSPWLSTSLDRVGGAKTLKQLLSQMSPPVLENILNPTVIIPGVVQSRINPALGRTRFTPYRDSQNQVSAGLNHVIAGHFGGNNRQSQFTISVDELKSIFSRKDVVSSPVTPLPTGNSTSYARIVDTGQVIGTVRKSDGGGSTSWIYIQTDRAGNLITSYPVPQPKN